MSTSHPLRTDPLIGTGKCPYFFMQFKSIVRKNTPKIITTANREITVKSIFIFCIFPSSTSRSRLPNNSCWGFRKIIFAKLVISHRSIALSHYFLCASSQQIVFSCSRKLYKIYLLIQLNSLLVFFL